MADKYTIKEFIDKYDYEGREKNVLDCINNYFRNNVDALSDGIIEYPIIFGDINRNRFYEAYNVDESLFKEFKRKNSGVIKNKVLDDFLYLLLWHSFCKTGNQIFVDMLSIIEIGSKFKKYFKYGVNSAKMKYVIENLNNKFQIKKYGSFFLMVQTKNRELFKGVLKAKVAKPYTDDNTSYIILRISTDINQSMKMISQQYYKAKDDVIFTQTEVNDTEDKISLSNNSILIDNLLNIIENYSPTTLDFQILNTLRIKSVIKKDIMKKLLLQKKDKKYFYRINKIFIDNFVEQYGSDITTMKRDFITKSVNGRYRDPNIKVLDKEILDDVQDCIKEWVSVTEDGDLDDLQNQANVLVFVKNIKNYCIIKCRSFMNSLS